MIRSHRMFTFILLAMGLPSYALCQVAADEPAPFQPASDAEIVTLDHPRHRVALPESASGKSPRGPDRSFPLDPSWHIARTAITEDGQTAYLLVFDTDRERQAKSSLNASVSIRRISLDTGEETARYDLPAPFDATQYPSAWGNGDAGLSVSASGQSLIVAFLGINLAPRVEADLKYRQAMTFFRWDTQTKELTDEQLAPSGIRGWKMLVGDDRMVVCKRGQDAWQIECWNPQDFAIIPLAEFVSCPTGEPRRDGTITIWRDCIAFNPAESTLDVMHHWRKRPPPGSKQIIWLNWLQKYDTNTGEPVGPGTKFRNTHDLEPLALRGEHLLLREQDRSGLDHRQAVHVWNIRTREHIAAIDLAPPTRSHINRVDLTPDGSAVIYERRLLDLRTLTWTEDRDGPEHAPITHTPDGRRWIEVTPAWWTEPTASPCLNVYDLK